MPLTTSGLYYEVSGRDAGAAPWLMLSAGLGGSARYWTPQLALLEQGFRVIGYDHRGTGRSPGALPMPYSVAAMAEDAREVLDCLEVESCSFIGHALGGLIGLEIALNQPQRLRQLVVVNGWVTAPAHTRRCFAVRRALLQHAGVAAYVQAQPIFLYPADWLTEHAAWIAAEEAAALGHFPGQDTVLRRIAALEAFDGSAALDRVTVPVLVLGSRDDVLVPSGASVALAAALPNARLVLLERGGHAVNITEPQLFAGPVLAFLDAS